MAPCGPLECPLGIQMRGDISGPTSFVSKNNDFGLKETIDWAYRRFAVPKWFHYLNFPK